MPYLYLNRSLKGPENYTSSGCSLYELSGANNLEIYYIEKS